MMKQNALALYLRLACVCLIPFWLAAEAHAAALNPQSKFERTFVQDLPGLVEELYARKLTSLAELEGLQAPASGFVFADASKRKPSYGHHLLLAYATLTHAIVKDGREGRGASLLKPLALDMIKTLWPRMKPETLQAALAGKQEAADELLNLVEPMLAAPRAYLILIEVVLSSPVLSQKLDTFFYELVVLQASLPQLKKAFVAAALANCTRFPAYLQSMLATPQGHLVKHNEQALEVHSQLADYTEARLVSELLSGLRLYDPAVGLQGRCKQALLKLFDFRHKQRAAAHAGLGDVWEEPFDVADFLRRLAAGEALAGQADFLRQLLKPDAQAKANATWLQAGLQAYEDARRQAVVSSGAARLLPSSSAGLVQVAINHAIVFGLEQVHAALADSAFLSEEASQQ